MKSLDQSSFFYSEVINLLDLNDHEFALKSIKKNIINLTKVDDIALAYLNCGFLNYKLGDYLSAIDDFSKSIYFEAKLDIMDLRSKDLSLNGRSNSRYKNGNYQGAIDDKRNAKNIRLLEINRFPESNDIKIDYKNILLGTFLKIDLEPKYKTLIKVSKIEKSRYDLIADYKKVISNKRKEEVIKKLELLSESKYKYGDYKASIRAIRRAEKYY
tara:strand:+ start:1430 stop:2071 length:642 start_codon:yes stop_codon:yes gene_type:complete